MSWLLILHIQSVDVLTGRIHLLCLPLYQPNAEVFQKQIPRNSEMPKKGGMDWQVESFENYWLRPVMQKDLFL